MGVEARAEGLYVRAAWNDLGEQNRAQGYLVYPSPAWLYDVRAARASGVIAPDELRSVGPDQHAAAAGTCPRGPTARTLFRKLTTALNL